MNCKECQSVLEQYFDRELEHDLASAVSSHLEECKVCAAEFSLLGAEQEVFHHYGSELEVPQDLWSGIQARLESPPRAARFYPPSQNTWAARLFAAPRLSLPVAAALVIAAVILTAIVMKTMSGPEKQLAGNSERKVPAEKVEPVQSASASASAQAVNPAAPSVEAESDVRSKNAPRRSPAIRRGTSSEASATKTAEQLVREAERKYLAAIDILSRDVGRTQSQIDPDARIKLDEALAAIDRTIAATRKVVKQRPDDPIAAQYLLSAYARKVDALREMATGAF